MSKTSLLDKINYEAPKNQKTPLWLVIFRIFFFILIVLFFSKPFLKNNSYISDDKYEKYLIVADIGWSMAKDWNKFKELVQEISQEAEKNKKEITSKDTYNIVSDTIVGVNARKSDNILQAKVIIISIIICALIGGGIGATWSDEFFGKGLLIGLGLGAFSGLILGFLGSGFYLIANLGPGPRDGLMTGLQKKTNLTKKMWSWCHGWVAWGTIFFRTYFVIVFTCLVVVFYFFMLLFILFYLLAETLLANKYDCIIATKKYEEIYGIPKNLLLSVSLTESGRRIKNGEFVSWPWTINRKGKGKFFNNK